MDQKWTKNEKKIIKNRIIKRYLKLALGLPMKMCQRIYGDLSRGVGSRGHSWGLPNGSKIRKKKEKNIKNLNYRKNFEISTRIAFGNVSENIR